MFWNKMKSVTTSELETLLIDKPEILDVREPHEFKNGHILGAKNLPREKSRPTPVKDPFTSSAKAA